MCSPANLSIHFASCQLVYHSATAPTQDTPGLVYGQTSVRIPDHIKAQNNAYLAWEQDPTRSAPMSASVDHRVDACLFFLNPNHLKDAEVAAMAALAEMVPVVPMIAKVNTAAPCSMLLLLLLLLLLCTV